jgi:hypothetical protein
MMTKHEPARHRLRADALFFIAFIILHDTRLHRR